MPRATFVHFRLCALQPLLLFSSGLAWEAVPGLAGLCALLGPVLHDEGEAGEPGRVGGGPTGALGLEGGREKVGAWWWEGALRTPGTAAGWRLSQGKKPKPLLD